MSGTLYLVATPIGNLEDITLRALRVLREAAAIACEDTRQTRKLLDHFGIQAPTLSCHEHNEAQRAAEIVDRLQQGENLALVSDAGTPLVSDPGYRVVNAAISAGIRVEPIPGASALTTALSASGLPTDSFHFAGFLPARGSPRKKALARLKDLAATLVFYEAPHRILETLGDIEEVLGPRQVVLARELTKVHEEFLRGTAAELRRSRITLKGEFTILVDRAGPAPAGEDATPVAEAVDALIQSGMSRMEAMKAVARERGLSKREVYREVEQT